MKTKIILIIVTCIVLVFVACANVASDETANNPSEEKPENEVEYPSEAVDENDCYALRAQIRSGDFSDAVGWDSDVDYRTIRRLSEAFERLEDYEWVEHDFDGDGSNELVLQSRMYTGGSRRILAIFTFYDEEAILVFSQTLPFTSYFLLKENGDLIRHVFSYGPIQGSTYSYYIFDDDWNLVRLRGLQIFEVYFLSELPDDWAEQNPEMPENGMYYFEFTMIDGVEYRQPIDREAFLDAFEELLGTSFYEATPGWYRVSRLSAEYYSALPTVDLMSIIRRGQYGITWEMNQDLPEDAGWGWSDRCQYPIFDALPNAEFTDIINQHIHDFVFQHYYHYFENPWDEELDGPRRYLPRLGTRAEVTFANPQLVSISLYTGVTYRTGWGNFTTFNFNPTTGEIYSPMDFIHIRGFVDAIILRGEDIDDCHCHSIRRLRIMEFRRDVIFTEDGVTLFRRFLAGREDDRTEYHFTFEELAPFLHTSD